MRSTRVGLIVLGVLLFWSGLAQAQLVTIQVTGYVTSFFDTANLLGGAIGEGTSLTGTYTYDTSVADSDASSSAGLYWQSSTQTGMKFNLGGVAFENDLSKGPFEVGVINDFQSRSDWYMVLSKNNKLINDFIVVDTIDMQLVDHSHAVFSSDELLLSPPNLQSFDEHTFLIDGYRGEDRFVFAGEVTSLKMIPEPMTMMLFGLGTMAFRKRIG